MTIPPIERQLEQERSLRCLIHDTLKVLAQSVLDGHPRAAEMARDIVSGKPLGTARMLSVGGSGFAMSSWAGRVLALNLRDVLDGPPPATNYVELTFHDAKGTLVVTVQRAEGKTPHALRVEAERERDLARAEVARMRGR